MDDGGEAYTRALELNLHPKPSGNGWAIYCPNKNHEDRNKSAKLFPDGWVHCFAACPRINILGKYIPRRVDNYKPKQVGPKINYFDYWLYLDTLKKGIKGLPASHLNQLGWRILPDENTLNVRGGIFIPYFTIDRTAMLFFQVRHDSGDRRFSFAPGQEPYANGLESLANMEKYIPITEGSSDRAVLEFLGIPAVAIPSASSHNILKGLADYANKNNKIIVACSDADDAGDRMLHALSKSAAYIDLRPPKPFKDYGDMFEAVGKEPILDRMKMILGKDRAIETEILDEQQFKERNESAWKILFS